MANDEGIMSVPASWSARRGSATNSAGIPPELAGRWGDPEEDARQALGEDDYRRARAEGYAMPSEQAVTYALEDHEQH